MYAITFGQPRQKYFALMWHVTRIYMMTSRRLSHIMPPSLSRKQLGRGYFLAHRLQPMAEDSEYLWTLINIYNAPTHPLPMDWVLWTNGSAGLRLSHSHIRWFARTSLNVKTRIEHVHQKALVVGSIFPSDILWRKVHCWLVCCFL